MRILCFVDIHADMRCVKRIKEKSKKADILVSAGDISIFGNRLDEILKELNKIGKPVLILSGNHETEEQMINADKRYKNIINIDKKTASIGDYIFLGYGGGGFSIQDPKFRRYAKAFKKKIKDKKTILVLHGPPYGFDVDLIHKEHAGNKDYTEFIINTKPALVVCGHLHETAGKKDKYKHTIIINPGWDGTIVEI